MTGPRVLVLHSSNELFGADLVLLRAVDALRDAGWEVLVLLPDDLPYEGELAGELRARGVEARTESLGILRRRYLRPWALPGFGLALLRAARRVIRIVRERRIDVIYSETSAVWCGAVAACRTGVPHVWHLHEIIERPRWFARLLAWMLARRARAVIAVSHAVRGHWLLLEPRLERTLTVIPNGLDLAYYDAGPERERARRDLGVAPETVLVGCLGRLGSWKGQEVLVDALARLRDESPDLKLEGLLAGGPVPGQERKVRALEQRIRERGLEDRVRLLPFHKDVRPWLAAMDILAVPSVNPDPLPTVVLEGMAARLPVAASDHGGPREMIVPGQTGVLTAPGDARALARALADLARDAALRRRLGEAGRRRLEEAFSLEAFRDRLLALFTAVRGAPPAPPAPSGETA